MAKNEKDLLNALDVAENKLGNVESPLQTAQSKLKQDRDKLIESQLSLGNNVFQRTPRGYINIAIEDLPSKGYFYPKGTLIQIRGASSESVEHYSIMNDQDPLDIRSHIMDLLVDNVRVVVGNKLMDVRDLIDGDKIYLLLSIYEYTFPNKENEILVTSQCPHCGNEHSYTLTKSLLSFITDIPLHLENKYNEEKRCFSINTKTLGKFDIVAPKMGVTYKIFDLYRKSPKINKLVKESFLTILPYLFDIRTNEVTQENVLALYNSYINENDSLTDTQKIKKYSLIYKLIEEMKIGLDPNVTVHCLEEETKDKTFTFPFELQHGWKSLFLVSDIFDEIL